MLSTLGKMEGRIGFEIAGENGFGYDPIFFLPEYGKTSAELTPEEKKAIRTKRFRMASGAGNVTAVITGTLVILLLLAFLMNMIGFVLNDADRNFTLFQTRF